MIIINVSYSDWHLINFIINGTSEARSIKPMIIIIVSYLKYINTLFNCMSLFNSMANYNICFSLCSRRLEVIGTGKNGAWKKESLVPYVLSSAHYSRAPATQVTLLLLELVFQPYIMYNQGMFTKWLHATHILKIWSVFPRISEHLGAYWKGYFYPRGEGWGSSYSEEGV